MTTNMATSTRPPVARGLARLFAGEGQLAGRPLQVLLVLSALCGGGAAFALMHLSTSKWEREMFLGAAKAHFALSPEKPVRVPNRYGDAYLDLPARQASTYTKYVAQRVKERLEWAALTFVVVFFLAMLGIYHLASRRGSSGLEAFVRGSSLSSTEALASRLARSGQLGDFALAGVPLLPGGERQHLLVLGATGTGKTVAIKELLRQVRAKGERAFVFDPEGEFAAEFRQENDIILNPFAPEMPRWSIWDEVSRDHQLAGFAEALFPLNRYQPFFDEACRCIFEDLVLALRAKDVATNSKLFEMATLKGAGELHEFLGGRPAAVHVNPAGKEKTESILSSFVNKMRLWSYLPECAAGQGFSIRKFVQNESEAAWIFATANEEQLGVSRRLLSLWTQIWVEAILSLPKSSTRIWTILDELPALNPIRVSDLLTRGRKHGACCVIGFQDSGQLDELYGAGRAQTIRSSCNTWLIFRQGDPKTAELASSGLGSTEVAETTETTSHTGKSEGLSVQKRRVLRPLVLQSELMQLANLRAYLRQPGLPVVPVTFRFVPHEPPPERRCRRESIDSAPDLQVVRASYGPRRRDLGSALDL